MVRVFGQLFDDGRDGVLVIKPSTPFFGAERYERHFNVVGGNIELELSPTPAGVYYNVGFKDHGDLRDPIYTLKWRIPNNTKEINITPRQSESEPPTTSISGSDMGNELHIKRLATELADELKIKQELQLKLSDALAKAQELSDKIHRLEITTETSLAAKDSELALLRQTHVSEPKTVYVTIPVPPKPLQERIEFLEAEVKRLMNLNDTYYAFVLELNQLKLEKAQTVHLPQKVEEIPDTPRQRLIQKLMAK
jgi:hypothetical protein